MIGRKTKLRIFNTNVKSVLLYGSETWRTTKAISRKIQTFVNRCLRRILQIYWPDTISNEDLWRTTGQEKMEMQIKRRRWGWIGHTLPKPNTNITKQALRRNPQEKRKRGHPRNSWQRTVEGEMREEGFNWQQMERQAQYRAGWRGVLKDLCPTWGERD